MSNPMDHSPLGFPVLHHLLELAQTHVHGVGDAINHLVLCRSLLLLPSIFISLFLAVLGLHCCSVFSSRGERGLLSSRSACTSHCHDFSYCTAQALGHVGFSSCGSWALDNRLSSCGSQAWLLRSTWESSQIRDWTHISSTGKQDSLPLSYQGSPGSP